MTKDSGASLSATGLSSSGSSQQAVSPLRASIPSARRSKDELADQPRPTTAAELEALSAWYFGMPLHLSVLRVYGEEAQYKVAERYNDYHGKGWLFSENCCRGYDYSRDFWEHVVGKLYCGGIALHSYGQTRNTKGDTDRLGVLADSVAAQTIETQSAKTEGLGPKDESAVAKPCAQGDSA